LFFVYPSTYEGWGLPVAEALALGKFGVVSSATSLPEVGGRFVEYCPPLDVAAWARTIKTYANDPDILANREKLVEAYQPMSWLMAGRHLVETLNNFRASPI
jgi:glycosyltransferase involved in cell wall biosynthesis